jgi:preprotein translocase SecE subunit
MARQPRRRTVAAPAAATPASEAARRSRENLPRPAPAPVASGVVRPTGPRKRRNPFAVLGRFEPRFIADIVSELRKVTWPTIAETRYLTIVVAIVAVTVGMFLGGIDLAFGWVVEKLFF